MNVSLQQGYPDNIGRKRVYAGSAIGPTSYSQTTADPVALPNFQHYIDSALSNGQLSVSGTYYVRFQPSAAGPRQTWKARYYVTSTNAEVANAVDLSGETFIVSFLGGNY